MTTAGRPDLAAFLRDRRERIRPAEVGLPGGPRRRTPGLRREEVAQLAGVGVTWYTWLEQGRPINASVQVLDAVARVLRLDPVEHDHLYRLADAGVVRRPPGSLDDRVDPAVQRVLDNLSPLAAAINNSRFDLLAWNTPYALGWPKVECPRGPRNLLWRLCVDTPCCSGPFRDPDRELPLVVASFRAAFAAHREDPSWLEFIEDLSAASPRFAGLWASQDVVGPATRTRVIAIPAVGDVRVSVVNFAVSAMPETRMAVYTPTDEEGWRRMRWLVDGHGAHGVRHLPPEG